MTNIELALNTLAEVATTEYSSDYLESAEQVDGHILPPAEEEK